MSDLPEIAEQFRPLIYAIRGASEDEYFAACTAIVDAIKRYGDEQRTEGYGLGMRHCIELEGPAP